MRRLVLILVGAMIGVACGGFASAQGIRFEQGSFEAAQAKAAKEKKMLLLVVCADWLEVCEIMNRDIFTDPEIGKAYNGRFVCWQLDAKEIEGSPFFAGVRILSIPEFIFFDAAGHPQYREKKLKDHDEMLAMAQAALNPQNHLSQLAEKYRTGNREPAFVRRYIVEMDAAGQDVKAASQAYLGKLSREALLETENWIIATIGVDKISDGVFQYVLGHLASFKKQYGEDAVNEFIIATYRKSLDEAVSQQNLTTLGECQAVVRQLMGPEQAKPVIAQDELTFHAAGGNWGAYEKSARGLFAIYQSEDAGLYNEAAWNIFQHGTMPETLKLAESWAQKSVDLEPAYWNYHTLASLQLKNGKRDLAMASARKAMEFVEPGTEEAKNVQELIEQIQK